jgi:hypothetical protein
MLRPSAIGLASGDCRPASNRVLKPLRSLNLQLKLVVDDNLSPETTNFLREKVFDVLSIDHEHKGRFDEEIFYIANTKR